MSGIDTFEQHYKTAFQRNLGIDAEQQNSRIAMHTDADYAFGEEGDSFTSDWIGNSDPKAVADRFGELPSGQVDKRRRVGHFETWDDGKILGSKLDKARQVSDPANKTVLAMKGGLARKQDDFVIRGMYGTTYSGRTGVTSVILPAAQKIAVDNHDFDNATGDKPMTLNKLKVLKKKFDESEIEGRRLIALPSTQVLHLLGETEVASSDYNTIKALAHGEIDTFMGFEFIQYEKIPDLSSNHRVLAWIPEAIEFRQRLLHPLDVWLRKDKRPHWYGYYQVDMAILRNQDAGVVEIACAKTAA